MFFDTLKVTTGPYICFFLFIHFGTCLMCDLILLLLLLFFCLKVTSGTGDVSDILERAKQRQINLRIFDDKTVSTKKCHYQKFACRNEEA